MLLDGTESLPALAGDQLTTQVVLALQSSNNLMLTSIVFWGLWLIPLGWLVFRSGFMPRVLGALLIYGSLFYVLIFFGTVLDTNYADTAFARIAGLVTGLPSIAAEFGAALWLLIMGARERAR